jgi:hypothetical protein
MRINEGKLTGSTAETGRAPETQRTERESTARVGGGSSSTSNDRVELSSALGSLSRVLSSFGSERAGRVQSLTTQYQSGGSIPDAVGTSRGVIAEALAGANG